MLLQHTAVDFYNNKLFKEGKKSLTLGMDKLVHLYASKT